MHYTKDETPYPNPEHHANCAKCMHQIETQPIRHENHKPNIYISHSVHSINSIGGIAVLGGNFLTEPDTGISMGLISTSESILTVVVSSTSTAGRFALEP